MPMATTLCPRGCQREIPQIEDWPADSDSQDGQWVESLASAVYECPAHGYFRIYISGAAVPVTPNPNRRAGEVYRLGL